MTTADDSWMDAPAPPPRSLDPVMNAPKPAPAEKPKPKVTPIRPLDALAAELDDPPIAAAPRPGDGLDPPDAPPADEALPPAEPGGPPSKERPRGEIWKGCPVKVLGVHGGIIYVLDVLGQLRGLAKLEGTEMMKLFGHRFPALCYHFPQWSKGDPPTRVKGKFDVYGIASAMSMAAAERGIFDPEGAVRGVGAWSDDDGQLVYHLGDRLIIAGEDHAPSTHQARIYPAQPPIPHPAADVGDSADPFTDLVETLQTWTWARPEIDPMIMAGTFGVQAFGGALDWRPATWITGGAGSGKSALQRLFLHLHGGEKGLVQSTDPTARGIAAQLGQSTLPVALDELEPGDTGSQKEKAIIETARVAASGGRWMRGSSDQKGSSGQLRSTFLFSSILIPGVLKSQDRQRMIILNLLPIPEGAKPPQLRPDTWRARGARIKRLIIDRWPTWAARLELWREALAAEGITGRNGDNWATTLAMACQMRQPALPSADELKGWAVKVAGHISADLGELGNDADEVLVHLLGQTIDPFRRGEQYTIAQWVQVAAESPNAPRGLCGAADSVLDLDDAERARRAKTANEHLAKMMIRVVQHGAGPRLFVGNTKAPGILALFRDTQWAGGAWAQSLARVKGAEPSKTARTLAGVPSRGIEIPLSAIPGLLAFPADQGRPAASVQPIRNLPEDLEDFQ